MPGLGGLLLTLAYLLPLVLLALTLAAQARRPRWLTGALLIALPLFYIGHFLGVGAVQGWPSDTPLPEEFALLGFQVVEPSARDEDGGKILLWAQQIGASQPRVHRLAYSRQLHESLVAAGHRQAQGAPQIGTRTRSTHAMSAQPRRGEDTIMFRDRQTGGLPPKESTP